jgi:hypothetical protein
MGRCLWTFAGTIIAALMVASLFAGCTATKGIQPGNLINALKKSPQEQPANEQIESDYIHEVKWQGETLSIIAKWYCGSLTKWHDLAEVNPDIDPNKIFIGNQIRIPDALLITHQPLPESYLAQFAQEPEAQENPVNNPSPEEEEFILFGPKSLSDAGKKQ